MKNSFSLPCAALSLAAAFLSPSVASAQAKYASPEAAADALIAAVSSDNTKALAKVLGKDWRKVIPANSVDPADRKAFLDKAKERRAVTLADARGELVVGNDPWAFPVPLKRGADSQWQFDLQGGQEAIRERRIGANERAAMQAVLAYVDAQREYARADHNGDGMLEYARRFLSTKGKRDGLIWDPALGGDSPLGEGYLPTKPNAGYHGYRFKILEAQGPRANDGTRSYLIGNRMMSGFALIAWPVTYGDSGVTSFMVNQDGVVYERDLGPNTADLAQGTTLYDPAYPWREAKP